MPRILMDEDGSCILRRLMHFAADVLNRRKVHSNGRTNHEMVTGHRFRAPACGFAEKVHFEVTKDKNRRNKMVTDWGIGYDLGCTGRTMEHLISAEDGVIVKCDTFKRNADDVDYDKQCIENIVVGYRQYVCEGTVSRIPLVR